MLSYSSTELTHAQADRPAGVKLSATVSAVLTGDWRWKMPLHVLASRGEREAQARERPIMGSPIKVGF